MSRIDQLPDSTIVDTGARRDIGRELVNLLGQRRRIVIGVARNIQPWRFPNDEGFHLVGADFCTRAGVEATVSGMEQALSTGGLTTLMNGAGGSRQSPPLVSQLRHQKDSSTDTHGNCTSAAEGRLGEAHGVRDPRAGFHNLLSAPNLPRVLPVRLESICAAVPEPLPAAGALGQHGGGRAHSWGTGHRTTDGSARPGSNCLREAGPLPPEQAQLDPHTTWDDLQLSAAKTGALAIPLIDQQD